MNEKIKELLFREANKSTLIRQIACAIVYENNIYLGHNRVTYHSSNKSQRPLRDL